MKTITLDDVAYSRLKAWKRGSKESFSQVVKRLLPEPGTLASFVNFTESRHTHKLPGNQIMEAAIDQRSSAKSDPWNS
jgi:negative regulator of replication initiation